VLLWCNSAATALPWTTRIFCWSKRLSHVVRPLLTLKQMSLQSFVRFNNPNY